MNVRQDLSNPKYTTYHSLNVGEVFRLKNSTDTNFYQKLTKETYSSYANRASCLVFGTVHLFRDSTYVEKVNGTFVENYSA